MHLSIPQVLRSSNEITIALASTRNKCRHIPSAITKFNLHNEEHELWGHETGSEAH